MNKELVVLVLMFICHYFADFVFQGQIALYKQKSWWKDNYPKDMYKHDWIISLFIHSIFWTLCILIIPLLFGLLTNVKWFILLLLLNSIYHAFIDNQKCNKLSINLIFDQLCHIAQIIGTYIIIILI